MPGAAGEEEGALAATHACRFAKAVLKLTAAAWATAVLVADPMAWAVLVPPLEAQAVAVTATSHRSMVSMVTGLPQLGCER